MLLKNSQYSQEKTCVKPLFDKVSRLKACIFILKKIPSRCFSANIAKFLRTAFLSKTCPLYHYKFFFDNRSCKLKPRFCVGSTTVPESLILIKLQASDLQLYLKKDSTRRCFPVNFAKFLRAPFL